MRFRDVKFAVPQIKRTLLLNEDMNKLEDASLDGGRITINSVNDNLLRCRLDHCKIVATVPLDIHTSYIMTPHAILNTKRLEDDQPRATIVDCFFNLCEMPKAHYEFNYIKTDSPDYELTKYGTNYLQKNPKIPIPADWKTEY